MEPNETDEQPFKCGTFPPTHDPTPMEEEVETIQQAKKRLAIVDDTKRLDWLLTEEGAFWLYDRVGASLTLTRLDIDLAMPR